jgi:hypothetical protein
MLLCAATLPDALATLLYAATLLILPLQRSRTLQRSSNTPGRCNCCFLATAAAAQASNLAFRQVVQERDTSGQFN